MWGKPPFPIPDNYAIDIRNLVALEMSIRKTSGCGRRISTVKKTPFTDLHVPNNDAFLSLLELPPGTFGQYPILREEAEIGTALVVRTRGRRRTNYH
jgi:hypothetical protein